ncbi:GDSL-type esterase/lipase family protein [Arthrobacter sp. Z1-9]
MGKVAKFLSFLLLPFLILVAAAPTPRSAPDAAYPRSMAALGDSITQAHSACCLPGDNPAQSWSTGDGASDGLTSHYERLLQLTPGIRGKNFNNAVSGAKASDLPRQAAAAAGQRAEYVTVLVGANDLCTPSLHTMTPVEGFRASVTRALETLDQMRPRPRVLVTSIPDIYQLWKVLRHDQAAQSAWSASRICQSMLAASNTEDMRRQVVQRELAFNEVLANACAEYQSCETDGGAVYAHGFSANHVSVLDYFHPSLQGQATLANITWQAAWQRN